MFAGQLSNRQNVIAALIFASAFCACILVVCYPGFMSYDSVRMLEEARTQVRGGIYPAMPVYLMRLFDIGGHGPTAMLLAQDFLVIFSVAFFLGAIGSPWYATPVALAGLLVLPTVAGSMLVVWKDVTTAAFMCFALVMIFHSRTVAPGRLRSWLKWLTIGALVVGTLIRFNAVTATAILACYWVATFYSPLRLWKKALAFVGILVGIGLLNMLVSTYSLPDLRRLERNNLAYGIMGYDLLGISKWAGVSLVPFDSSMEPNPGKSAIGDIDKIYSSLGVIAIGDKNRALGNPVRIFPTRYSTSDVAGAWLDGIFSHPLAYLRYRWDLFGELVGAKPYATFEPTHFNRIDENPFGITFKEREVTADALAYIEASSAETWSKPWLTLLISIAATAVVLLIPRFSPDIKRFSVFATLTSAAYILPFFILTGTGEVRYSYPSLVISAMAIFAMIFGASRPGLGHRIMAPIPVNSMSDNI